MSGRLPIAILLGFCLMQARIIQTAGEWSMVLLLGSILAEVLTLEGFDVIMRVMAYYS